MDDFLMRPKIDFAFKEIMTDERARIGFLSAVLKTGQQYDVFKKCVSISILDCDLFGKETGSYSCFHYNGGYTSLTTGI